MDKELEKTKVGTLIRMVNMECPLCGKTHELELRRRKTETMIKGREVSYEESYYLCELVEDDENEFVNAKLNKKNLLNARNEYRKQMGLLTSDEIVKIREQYGLSQADFSLLLDWGEVTISRYESKAIQDEAYDNVLRIIKENPLKANEYLEKNKAKFNYEKYSQIRDNIIKCIDNYGKEYLGRQMLEGLYVRYSEPSDFNGNTTLKIDKLESVITYFAKRTNKLYKVKLMKMLWYADSLNYKFHGNAITGLVYQHNDMGALPVGHNEILDLAKVNVSIEEKYDYTMYHILPNDELTLSNISSQELDILDQVILKFKDLKAKEIVDYMHEETAYKKTVQGEVIPFSLAKEIRDF